MEKKTLSLPHQYRPPRITNEPAPALLLLHGFGSDENDLFSFAEALPDAYHIISLRAPIPMQPYGNAWYNIYLDASADKFSDTEQAIASRELISGCIDEIIEKYQATTDGITLLGFSQGTILSYAVALSYPEKVKQVIGLSGYIDTDILKSDYREHDFSHLSVYASHGSADQVIPVQWARKTAPFLKELGIPCSYSEFPVGHGVAPQNFEELKTWLLEHT